MCTLLRREVKRTKMSLSRKSLYGIVVGAIIALGILVAGTYAVTGNFFGLGGSTGTLQLSITDPPNAPANVTGVTITYTSIQVHYENSSGQPWFPVASHGSIDLMQVTSTSKLLGSASIPSGTYNLVRFNITSATITVTSNTGVKSTYQATIPNGMIQVAILNKVTVKAGQTSAVLIDISPRVTGNSLAGYMLVPAVTVSPTTAK
jgi:Domain of unknown function (DUF4382)